MASSWPPELMLSGIPNVNDDKTVVAFSRIDAGKGISWATSRYNVCPSLRKPGYGCTQSKPSIAVDCMATGVLKAAEG